MFSFLDNVIKSRNEWLSTPYYHYPNPKFNPKIKPILNPSTNTKPNPAQ